MSIGQGPAPRAIPVPQTALFPLEQGSNDRKGLVVFKKVDVCEGVSCLAQEFFPGGNRPRRTQEGRDADLAGVQKFQRRPQAVVPAIPLRREDDEGRAIIRQAGIGRRQDRFHRPRASLDTSLAEQGFRLGRRKEGGHAGRQPFAHAVADALVLRAAEEGYNDLVQAPGIAGRLGPRVAVDGDGVQLRPADAVEVGRPFRAFQHGLGARRMRGKLRYLEAFRRIARIVGRVVFQGLHGTRFKASGHHHVGQAAADFQQGEFHGRRRRRALHIDGQGRHVLAEPAEQPRQARDVAARPDGIASVKIRGIPHGRIALPQCPQDPCRQPFRRHVAENPVAHADVAAQAAQHVDSFHRTVPRFCKISIL